MNRLGLLMAEAMLLSTKRRCFVFDYNGFTNTITIKYYPNAIPFEEAIEFSCAINSLEEADKACDFLESKLKL